MLRKLLVVSGVALLAAGGVAAAAHIYGAALYLFIAGGASSVGVIFER